MQYLIMCEGANEKGLIDILLDEGLLKINRSDVLNREVFSAKQIYNSPKVIKALDIYNKPVIIWRIGDTLKDKLKIKKAYEHLILRIEKYCTKPELEILLIISENLLNEYNKVKSKQAPKEFCSEKIKINGKKYYAGTQQLKEYYDGKDVKKLVDAIKEYKEKHKNSKINNENYLADILK